VKLNLQGIEVKAARVLVGMKGHRPSGFSACIGAKMKGNSYPKPSEGQGGRHNVNVHRDFVRAAIDCGANVSPSARRKFGL
jgi:hypothetical protein